MDSSFQKFIKYVNKMFSFKYSKTKYISTFIFRAID